VLFWDGIVHHGTHALILLFWLQISRTFHFGTHGGASLNQFGEQLGSILLNQEAIDWSRVNVEYLVDENYEANYLDMVQSSFLTHNVRDALQEVKLQNVRLEYSTFTEFQQLATQLHLMADEKAGVPRTAYKGIVETRPHGDYLLFVVPQDL
jgi:alpha-1,3-mannosyl-glycoprotein beta-1,2-N-acetylglucosaminyltransferase